MSACDLTKGGKCAIVLGMDKNDIYKEVARKTVEAKKYFNTEDDVEGKGIVVNNEEGEEQEVVLELEEDTSDEKEVQEES